MKRTVQSDDDDDDDDEDNKENVGMGLKTRIQMTSSTGSDKICLSVLVTMCRQQK